MPATERVMNIRSDTPSTHSTEESLMLMMNSLPMAGSEFLMACGKTTLRMACQCVMPSERAASICPASTARMPPRSTSARYAVELSETVTRPEMKSDQTRLISVTLMPVRLKRLKIA